MSKGNRIKRHFELVPDMMDNCEPLGKNGECSNYYCELNNEGVCRVAKDLKSGYSPSNKPYGY